MQVKASKMLIVGILVMVGPTFCVAGGKITKQKPKNNVCKTFADYYKDKDNNPNCFYNPDMFDDAVSISATL